MYTHEQQLQIAIAYAQSVSDKETDAKDFLIKVNEMLHELQPKPENPFKPNIDPSKVRI